MKALPDRIVAMPAKLGQAGYAVREQMGDNEAHRIDTDTDPAGGANGGFARGGGTEVQAVLRYVINHA